MKKIDKTKDELIQELNALKKAYKTLKTKYDKDIKTRKQADVALLDSENEMQIILESTTDAILAIDSNGKVIKTNKRFADLLHIPKALLDTQNDETIFNFVMEQLIDPELFLSKLKLLYKSTDEDIDVMDFKDGRVFERYSGPLLKEDSSVARVWSFRDITERKNAEEERVANLELLHIINETNSKEALIHSSVTFLKQWMNCDAVGIRLREVEDYPYYETSGFPPRFVKAEKYLCSYNSKGEIERDDVGNPILECMCGNIIRSRFDPLKSFFTPHGSFWTNCTTDLLASTTEEDRQARTRNRCNGEDYESVGLFPLSFGGETFGLMQINNKKEGLFTTRNLAILERFADNLAIAFKNHLSNESLVQSEERLTRFMESATEGFVLFDSDLNHVMVNQMALTLTGLKQQDIIGKNIIDTVPGISESGRYDAYKEVMRTGAPYSITDLINHPLTGKRNIELRAFRVGDGLGITFTDITERKQAEQALRENEHKLFSIYNTVGEIIFQLAVEEEEHYRFTTVNNAFCKVTGLPLVAVIGKRVNDVIPEPSLTIVLEKYREAINKNTIIRWEETSDYPTGRLIGDVSIAPIFNDQGKCTYLVGSVHDITERKRAEKTLRESEERFRTLFESAFDGIFVADENGYYVDVNTNGAQMLGYQRDEIIGMHLFDLVQQEKISLVDEDYKEVKTGIPYHREWEFKRKDGSILQGDLIGSTLPNGNVLGIVRDITERKQAELIIQQQNNQLQELNAAKDKFFSIIAHDLKSPFLGFLNLTEIMATESQNFTISQFADISQNLNESAVNIYQLMENLLKWAVLRQGKMSFNLQKQNLYSMVSQNISTIMDRAKQKGISIVNQVNDSLNVSADEQMINTVLRNLISNAVKFTERDGKVIIQSKKTDANMLEVSISDTGIGMDEKIIQRLFKIEEKVGSKGTDNEPSTGLGLLLCKEFVEKNGGRIWVESKENVGSTFYFTLQKVD